MTDKIPALEKESKAGLKGYFHNMKPEIRTTRSKSREASRSTSQSEKPAAIDDDDQKLPSPASPPSKPLSPTPKHQTSISSMFAKIPRTSASAVHGAPPSRVTKSQPPPSLSRKKSAGYAPPSRYSHVENNLSDTLEPGLICVFIGLNPGLTTATKGHAYAHPSNLFWRLLESSGCTGRRCEPAETYALPKLYNLGNTNIVSRATANGAELSKEEMDAGVAILDEKVSKCRPMAVVIVGKSIWESIWRVWMGRALRKGEFKYGWQEGDRLRMGRPGRSGVPKASEIDGAAGGDGEGKEGATEPWKGARVFVATTTSGLAASMSLQEKQRIWRELGQWVESEREKRGLVGGRYLEDGEVVTKK